MEIPVLSAWPTDTEYDPMADQTYTTIVAVTATDCQYYHFHAGIDFDSGRYIADVENGSNFVANPFKIPAGVECRLHPGYYDLPVVTVDFIHPETGAFVYRVGIESKNLQYARGGVIEFGAPGFDTFSLDAYTNLTGGV